MSEMRTVPLSDSGIEASVMGYGTYHLLDKMDPKDAVDSMGRAYEAGIILFDTSDNYLGPELVIGRAVRDGVLPRDDVVIATKTGIPASYYDAVERRDGGTSPERIKRQVEKSLWALGDEVGVIDLYQLHVPDDTVEPAAHAETMAELIEAGKIRSYGVSNYSAQQLTSLLEACNSRGLPRPVSIQNIHTILTDYGDEPALELARQQGLTVLAHSPLLKGGLTEGGVSFLSEIVAEKEKQFHETPSEDAQNELAVWQHDLNALKDISEYVQSRGLTLAEFALGWLASQEATVVVTAVTKPEYVSAAVTAARAEFSEADETFVQSLRDDGVFRSVAGRLLHLMQFDKRYFKKL